MQSNATSSGIILDGAMLSIESVDVAPLGLESQEEALRACLAPMLKGTAPLNAWLHGRPGSGKTLLARHVVDEVCGSGARIGVHVNCWQHRTLYSVLQAIVDKLKILSAEAQDTDVKLNRILQALRGRPAVVVLDDIDRPMPQQREEIVRGLLGLPQVGLVCMAVSDQALSALDDGTRSRLSPVLIEMPGYSERELEHIMTDRAQRGLAPDSLPPSAIKRLASAAHGNARTAIQLLRQAAALAEKRGITRIDPRSIDRLSRQYQAIPEERLLVVLTDHERIMLALAKKHAPVRTPELARLYLKHCRNHQIEPIARRTFTKYLNRLACAGVLDVASRSSGSGGRIIKAA